MFTIAELYLINWLFLTIFLPEALTQVHKQPEIFKCSPEVYQSRMRIFPSLRAPISEKAEEYWEKIIGKKSLFRFNFTHQPFHCSNLSKSRVYNLAKRNNFKRRKIGRENQFILNDFYWTPEGTLKTSRNNIYEWNSPNNYCISKLTHENVKVEVCPPTCGQLDICIPKCCALNQVLSFNYSHHQSFSCKEIVGPEWRPLIYQTMVGDRSIFEKSSKNQSIHFTHHKVPCRPFEILTPSLLGNKIYRYDRGIIRILEDSRVVTRKTTNHPWRTLTMDFCLDRIWDTETTSEFKPSEQTLVIAHCEKPNPTNFTPSKVYLPTFTISSIFALLTVLVYVILWDKQNVHGWTIAMFSVCMFLNLVTSAFAYGVGLFQERDTIRPGSTTCVVIGVLNHFFDVAMFSWLTVLCFDLWTTLSSMAPASSRTKGYKKFLGYICFGFGVPSIVVSAALAIDFTYKDVENTKVYKPLYGQEICGVDKTSFVYYTTLVNMTLYFINLIFAGLVLKTLREFKHGTKQATSSSSKKSTSRYTIYLKLFVIMGITWIFEFIAWFAAGEDVKWYWSLFDVYNILQTVGIFWIFVCKSEIKDQLFEKLHSFKHTFASLGNNAYRLYRRDSHSLNTSME